MQTISFKISGTSPLIQANPQTVNPFNKYTKELSTLTSKRKKTEDDLMEISHIKFIASLYYDKDKGYLIPASHFWKSIVEASRENKLGKKFERSFIINCDCQIDFPDKECSPEELYSKEEYVDVREVGIKGAKITTTRVIFQKWSTIVDCIYDETQLDEHDIINAMGIAGMRYGVGTYRKGMYGRFDAEKIKKTKKQYELA